MEKRDFTAEYKTRVVLEVLEGEKMANEIALREKLNPKVVSNWKQEFSRKFATLMTKDLKTQNLSQFRDPRISHTL